MAKLLIKNINVSNNSYSDGLTIENKLLKIAKSRKQLSSNDEWPVIYHFSKHRENILNWYPFKKNCSILEIGSGCGALTNLLSRRALKVDSIELELSRAKINCERNINTNNINIIVDNIKNIESKKYDYVVIIGVLEYASRYYHSSNNSFVDLLSNCKSFLKKDGIILLAIENRFGLKYFSGYKEDHLNARFVGINGYRNNDVKTFTRVELEEICKKAKLKIKKWYYPFPDYKFPFEIFTDKSINRIIPMSSSLPIDFDQRCFFDVDDVYRSLMNENICQHFANSFLLEINNASKENIDYVKINSNRYKKFSMISCIDFKSNTVYKKSLFKEANNHLLKMSKNTIESDLFMGIKYRYKKGTLNYKLIKGNNLIDIFYKLKNDNNIGEIEKIIYSIKESLYKGTRKVEKPSNSFNKVFGRTNINKTLYWNKKQNIDIIASNVVINNGDYYLIDNEWIFNFSIPSEYIMWRFMYYLPFDNLFSKEKIVYDILDIDYDIYNSFYQMELHFVSKYVGTTREPFYKKREIIKKS